MSVRVSHKGPGSTGLDEPEAEDREQSWSVEREEKEAWIVPDVELRPTETLQRSWRTDNKEDSSVGTSEGIQVSLHEEIFQPEITQENTETNTRVLKFWQPATFYPASEKAQWAGGIWSSTQSCDGLVLFSGKPTGGDQQKGGEKGNVKQTAQTLNKYIQSYGTFLLTCRWYLMYTSRKC